MPYLNIIPSLDNIETGITSNSSQITVLQAYDTQNDIDLDIIELGITNHTNRITSLEDATNYGVTDGSAASPSLYFNSDTDTGFYRTGSNEIGFSTGGAFRMKLDGAGRLGIGTASPLSALQVVGTRDNSPATKGIHLGEAGTNDYAIDICAAGSTNNSYIDFTYANDSVDFGGRILYSHDPDNFKFFTNAIGNASRLTISSTGGIGIGTDSPGYLLDVNGTSRFVGGLTVNNVIAGVSYSNWESKLNDLEYRISLLE